MVPFPSEGRRPRVEDFLEDGRLVPRRRPPVSGVKAGGDAAREALSSGEAVEELRRAAMADATRLSYGSHVRAFAAWCEERGVEALPASPETVEAHLVDFVTHRDALGNAQFSSDGVLLRAVTSGTVGIRLAAINKLHAYAGFTSPGSESVVRDIVRSIRRYFGVRPERQKAAIDHDALRSMLAVVEADRFVTVRDAAALVLRAAGWSSGQIARAEWSGVEFRGSRVRVAVGPDRRGGGARRSVLSPSCGLEPADVFTRLRELSPAAGGRVFLAGAAGAAALSRQAVMALVNRWTGGRYAVWPDVESSELAEMVNTALAGGSLSTRATRDAALLTTGWFLAARRATLTALRWRDVEFLSDAIRVLIRRSKTDQEGKGHVLWLTDVPGAVEAGVVSPTAALRRWRECLTATVGEEPAVAFPAGRVFPQLTRSGRLVLGEDGLPAPLSGARINSLVQEYASLAGLDVGAGETWCGGEGGSVFGAHSLRVGFVTEAVREGRLTVAQVMDITQHSTPAMTMRYVREVNARHRNPVTDLIGGLASREPEPEVDDWDAEDWGRPML